MPGYVAPTFASSSRLRYEQRRQQAEREQLRRVSDEITGRQQAASVVQKHTPNERAAWRHQWGTDDNPAGLPYEVPRQ